MKKPSIKDVAREAGVSTATVSHVFSGKKFVKEPLARKVRQAADRMGYTVDRVASQLRSGRTNIVAVIVPSLEDLFLNSFISRIESLAEDAGYQIIVACSRDDAETERERLRALMGWRPSGLIIVPYLKEVPGNLATEHPDVPTVAVDRINPAFSRYDTVTIDNFASGRSVADHMISQGAKSLLVLSSIDDVYTLEERIRGIKDRAAEDSSASVEVLVVGRDPEIGAKRLSDWVQSHGSPSALIGLSNVMTLAALSTFSARNIEIPNDVLLAGFHDSLWMTARKTPITTVVQPVDAVAKSAWDRLQHRIEGDDGPVQNIVFKSELVVRRSTLKP